jgi:hypothetical protein
MLFRLPVAHHEVGVSFGLRFKDIHVEETWSVVDGVGPRAKQAFEPLAIVRPASDRVDGDEPAVSGGGVPRVHGQRLLKSVLSPKGSMGLDRYMSDMRHLTRTWFSSN